jgi:hypothetical protein
MIFDNSLEPISCTLISIHRDQVPIYQSGDRYGFPSRIEYRPYSGGELIIVFSQLQNQDRLRTNLRSHFILTNDHEKTYLLDCMIVGYEIQQSLFNTTYKILFYVCNVGKRSLPIPNWEILPHYDSHNI